MIRRCWFKPLSVRNLPRAQLKCIDFKTTYHFSPYYASHPHNSESTILDHAFFSTSPVSDTFPTRLMFYYPTGISVFFLFLIRFIVHIIILPSSMLRCCALIKRTLFTNKKIHQNENPNGKEQKRIVSDFSLHQIGNILSNESFSFNQSLHPCFELHIIPS